jgi:tetratricopeptide (TPR) repeat protein
MSPRNIIRAVCALAFAAASLSPSWSEPDGKARAQVFSRQLATGERIEFSWDSHEKVPFSIDRAGNQVILHFERPVRLRWGPTLNALRRYVQQVESSDGGSTVTLTLSQPFRADYYRADTARTVEDDTNGINLIKTPGTPSAPVTALTLPESPPGEEPVRRKTTHRHEKKIEQARHSRPPAKAPTQEAKTLATLSPSAGGPGPLPVATVSPAPPAQAAQGPQPVTPPPPSPPTTIGAHAPGGTAALSLPYKNDDPFAVFEWQKKLWIVSESPAAPSADDLRRQGAPFVKDVQTLSDAHATILAMPLDGDVSASVEKLPSGQLQILLRNGPGTLARQLVPSLKTAAGKTSLVIASGKATRSISVRDPQTGFMLDVVPVPEPGAGIRVPRSFVEFNLLPSAQGLAIESKSDAISVSVQKGVTEIASAGGLAISPALTRQIAEAEAEAKFARLPPTLFPYARWKLDDEKDFVPTQIRLLHDIVYSDPDDANKARLQLLGLFLGEGLFSEAIGMADDILRSSLKFYQDNKVSALRGAAYLFMYRFSEAERDFSAPELNGDPEALMWRTLCRELLGSGTETFDFSANYERYISHYPPTFIGKLAIIAADRSINRKQYDAATAIFDTLRHDNLDEPVKKYIDYMQAKILSETHSESEAVAIWTEQAKLLEDPLIRARAEFSLINLLLKQGKISHEEAEKRLDKLRIVWRGDSLELSVLTLMGNLYLQGKQYDKALRTMRDIVQYYPQVPEAVTTARKMEEAFVTLYNKGAADDMPPLEALSLFYEFHDLVPIGKNGDLMIRNLADRLVNIDLLDRAAQLLDHQIRNRLDGEERSRVGAQLARIYLLNHKPDSALDTLKTTGYGDLPPDLQLVRLRLTAQALAQQGKVARAIDVISTDNSAEGSALRLGIYWDNKDWQNVVTIAEDILGNRNDPGAALSAQESEVLLKLATAYVYEHDTGQLQYLRDYFTPLMKNNPNQKSFQFITSESGAVDYDNLANLDTDIDAVKSFLNSNPQDRPGKNGLSKAAN